MHGGKWSPYEAAKSEGYMEGREAMLELARKAVDLSFCSEVKDGVKDAIRFRRTRPEDPQPQMLHTVQTRI